MFLIPFGNHPQVEGGSAAERLMSTLAYGWVERCSDIASCGTSFASKISIYCVSIPAIVLVYKSI